MRSRVPLLLVIVAVLSVATGCKSPAPTPTPDPALPAPPPIEEAVTAPEATEDPIDCVGEWAVADSILQLEDDGTGFVASTVDGDDREPVAWRVEGDQVILSLYGLDNFGALSEDGLCLALRDGSGSRPTVLPRALGDVDTGTCAGRWVLPCYTFRASNDTFVLRDDGSGIVRPGWGRGGDPITWRQEGGGFILSSRGKEATATPSDDPDAMIFDSRYGSGAIRLVRLCPGALAACTGIGPPPADTPRPAGEAVPLGQCVRNVRQINAGLLQYAWDWDETFPPPEVAWEDVIQPYLRSPELLSCPDDTTPPSYALNEKLKGRSQGSVQQPGATVTIFESDDGKTVAHRHGGKAVIGYADGHVGCPEDDSSLVWSPDTPPDRAGAKPMRPDPGSSGMPTR